MRTQRNLAVHYLCHPPEDSLNFVYAAELPSDYYSPGIFCVESRNRSGGLHDSYGFLARMGEQMIESTLERTDDRTFSIFIESVSLTFLFKAVILNRAARYIGDEQDRFSDVPFFRMQPVNDQRLERACLEHDFYFVGIGIERLQDADNG
jgi:hypothetical protein